MDKQNFGQNKYGMKLTMILRNRHDPTIDIVCKKNQANKKLPYKCWCLLSNEEIKPRPEVEVSYLWAVTTYCCIQYIYIRRAETVMNNAVSDVGKFRL